MGYEGPICGVRWCRAHNQRPAKVGLLLVLTALFALLSTGVIRGWRWTFWLILVAFMSGILHVLAAAGRCDAR